jgi:hypothetical protein
MNAYNKFALFEENLKSYYMYVEKVNVYLPLTYTYLIRNIFQVIKDDVSVTTMIKYNDNNELIITGTNYNDVFYLKYKYDEIIANIFNVFIENEFGNIGKWEDV